MKRTIDPNQLGLPGLWVPTVVVAQGDGSYVVKSGRPVSELTPLQAARALGISRSAVYQLVEAGRLKCRRPLPRKILISAEEIEQFRRSTEDPEFWSRLKSTTPAI